MDRYRVTPTFCNTTLSARSDLFTPSFSISAKPSHLQLQEPPLISSYLRSSTRCTDDTAQLSIFGAERYFRDSSNASFDERCVDIVSTNPRDSSVSSADGSWPRNCRTSSSNGTPTVSSQASWNSRSGLLSSTREQSKNTQPGTPRRLFGRKCPCTGKKSVTVDDALVVEQKSPMSSIQPKLEVTSSSFREKMKPSMQAGEVIFDFTTTIQISPPKVMIKSTEVEDMEYSEITKMKITPGCNNNWPKTKTPLFSPMPSSIPTFPAEIGHRLVNSSNFSFPDINESVEVFQPTKPRTALNTSSSSTAHRSFTYLSPPLPPAPMLEEEARSDASSDLFELESFATSSYPTSTYNRRRRDSLDDETATEAASVVWSVNTAEGFDRTSAANFSSAASGCYYGGDEFRFMQAEHDRFAAAMTRKDEVAGPKKPGGGGLLSSCRCEKAVSVGPNPVRIESVRAAEAGLAMLAESVKPARVCLPVRT